MNFITRPLISTMLRTLWLYPKAGNSPMRAYDFITRLIALGIQSLARYPVWGLLGILLAGAPPLRAETVTWTGPTTVGGTTYSGSISISRSGQANLFTVTGTANGNTSGVVTSLN